MQFFDDSLHPENMEKVVITVAPYGPEWMPEDFPEDIPLTMDEQVQKAVECYDAGATVLHLHVRELDGTGSKRLSQFNALIAGVREGVIDAICSDHQPLNAAAKLAPFAEALPGMSTLETVLPLGLQLVRAGELEAGRLIAALSSAPAGIIGIPAGSLIRPTVSPDS